MVALHCLLKEELNLFKRNVLFLAESKCTKSSATKPSEQFLDVIGGKV